MTQKELLYLEDAICHEKSLCDICNNTASNLKNTDLVSFIKNEINVHKQIKDTLLNLLREESNGR